MLFLFFSLCLFGAAAANCGSNADVDGNCYALEAMDQQVKFKHLKADGWSVACAQY